MILTRALAACVAAVRQRDAHGGFRGTGVVSPDWVGKLDAAKNAQQMLIAAAVRSDGTDAWITLHEKQSDGTWHMLMAAPGFIGEHGLFKTREGDKKTPVGVYRFNRAFGIADDPGCAIPYVKVDDDMYWSSDSREGYHYNHLIRRKEIPGLDTENGTLEHLIDCTFQYQYCLNISYNEEGIPGLGSAIFLHCFGPEKHFTEGCIAISRDHMRFVMQRVNKDTIIVIDSYENLSGGAEMPGSPWSRGRILRGNSKTAHR